MALSSTGLAGEDRCAVFVAVFEMVVGQIGQSLGGTVRLLPSTGWRVPDPDKGGGIDAFSIGPFRWLHRVRIGR